MTCRGKYGETFLEKKNKNIHHHGDIRLEAAAVYRESETKWKTVETLEITENCQTGGGEETSAASALPDF